MEQDWDCSILGVWGPNQMFGGPWAAERLANK